jgi:hypothetical protein
MMYYHSYMQQRESECMVRSQIDRKVRISNDFFTVCPTVESTSPNAYRRETFQMFAMSQVFC